MKKSKGLTTAALFVFGIALGPVLAFVASIILQIAYRGIFDMDIGVHSSQNFIQYALIISASILLSLLAVILTAGIREMYVVAREKALKADYIDKLASHASYRVVANNSGDALQNFSRMHSVSRIKQYFFELVALTLTLLVIAVYVILYIQPQMLLMFGGVITFIFLMSNILMRAQKHAMAAWGKEADSLTYLMDVMAGMHIIKSYSMEDRFYMRYCKKTQEIARYEYRKKRTQIGASYIQVIMQILVMVAIPIWSYYLVLLGSMSPGSMASAILFFSITVEYINKWIATLSALIMSRTARKHNEKVSETIMLAEQQGTNKTFSKSLAGAGIYFQYDMLPILEDASFIWPNKGLIAIVGASGAGKSTFLKLLAGLEDVDAGEFQFDSIAVNATELRMAASLAMQDTRLFPVTAMENIQYADEGLHKEKIESDLLALGLWPLIETLPQGLNTELVVDGQNISGGQRQVVAIMRAIMKESPLLLLDEPFSSQDIRTEECLVEAMVQLAQKRLVVIVTHRSDILSKCTHIIRLENGRLVEEYI